MAKVEDVTDPNTKEPDQNIRIGIKISKPTYSKLKRLARQDRRYRDFIFLETTLKFESLVSSAWNGGRLKPLAKLVWEAKGAMAKPAQDEDLTDDLDGYDEEEDDEAEGD